MNEFWEVIGESVPARRRITPIPVPYNLWDPVFHLAAFPPAYISSGSIDEDIIL